MGWTTLTHARLRAAQGDVSGARRIAQRILSRDPGDSGARRLLDGLDGQAEVPAASDDDEPPVAERVLGDPHAERERFRRALGGPKDASARRAARVRLARWLSRIESRSQASAVLFRRDRG